jgi:CO/xanthine dehydrogenase FAD-binding subunit
MVSAAFSYLKIFSLNEAVQALRDHDEDARLLAGGQSLVPMLNLRLAMPSVLIDINAADSREPFLDDGTLVIPALTRHARLISSPMIAGRAPMLSAAVSHVGNVRVRNRGTIGGSLAHADPTAEISCTALSALLGEDGSLHPLQEAFLRLGGSQCGFCTPGVILTAYSLTRRERSPSREQGQGASFPDYTYGTHAAEVEVDPETGEVRVLRYVASHDVGRAINPMRVEGQIQGGAMQGLGYALMEEIVLEEGCTASSLFSSYFIPTAMDMPDIEVEIVESGEGKGPLGARGIGEPPMGPAAPAIANAIADAIGCRPTRLPMTAERVLALLDEQQATSEPAPQ